MDLEEQLDLALAEGDAEDARKREEENQAAWWDFWARHPEEVYGRGVEWRPDRRGVADRDPGGE